MAELLVEEVLEREGAGAVRRLGRIEGGSG
jgi:hypothetical protein